MKKFLTYFSGLILVSLIIGCSDDEPALTESFFKIYDDSDADLSYKPIDIVETVDGFIVLTGTELSNSNFEGVQLLKMNEQGDFVGELTLSDYVVPVGEMHQIDSISYFFVMNPTTLSAVLIGVNPQLELETETTIGALNYPLASSITSTNDLLLLSYDPLNLTTEISQVSTDGSFVGASYTIGAGADVEQDIINHYLGVSDQPLPFFCGEIAPGSYYFNGFYNFSFSLVFSDLSATPTGVLQGQSSNAGVRALLPLSGGNFALAGFQFDDNFQLSEVGLSTTAIASSVDLYPGNMAELKAYTPTKIISYSNGTDTYTVFAAESKSRQILLYFYNTSTGEIEGIETLGFLNPYTFASIKASADNSIVVLGATFVAGRYERIALTKLSESDIAAIIN